MNAPHPPATSGSLAAAAPSGFEDHFPLPPAGAAYTADGPGAPRQRGAPGSAAASSSGGVREEGRYDPGLAVPPEALAGVPQIQGAAVFDLFSGGAAMFDAQARIIISACIKAYFCEYRSVGLPSFRPAKLFF